MKYQKQIVRRGNGLDVGLSAYFARPYSPALDQIAIRLHFGILLRLRHARFGEDPDITFDIANQGGLKNNFGLRLPERPFQFINIVCDCGFFAFEKTINGGAKFCILQPVIRMRGDGH